MTWDQEKALRSTPWARILEKRRKEMRTPEETNKRKDQIDFLIESLSNPPLLNVSDNVFVFGPEVCLESFRIKTSYNQISCRLLLGFGQLLHSLKGRTIKDVKWVMASDSSFNASFNDETGYIGSYMVTLKNDTEEQTK
jgi:hypothetical protein